MLFLNGLNTVGVTVTLVTYVRLIYCIVVTLAVVVIFCIVDAILHNVPTDKSLGGANALIIETTEFGPDPVMSSPLVSKLNANGLPSIKLST